MRSALFKNDSPFFESEQKLHAFLPSSLSTSDVTVIVQPARRGDSTYYRPSSILDNFAGKPDISFPLTEKRRNDP